MQWYRLYLQRYCDKLKHFSASRFLTDREYDRKSVNTTASRLYVSYHTNMKYIMGFINKDLIKEILPMFIGGGIVTMIGYFFWVPDLLMMEDELIQHMVRSLFLHIFLPFVFVFFLLTLMTDNIGQVDKVRMTMCVSVVLVLCLCVSVI